MRRAESYAHGLSVASLGVVDLPEDYTNAFTPSGALSELPATGPRGLNTITGRINGLSKGSEHVLNVVTQFGADPTGVAASDAAFLAAFTAAVQGATNTFSAASRAIYTIYVPAGTYLITGNGKLIADLAIATTCGIRWFGDGVDASMIVYQPAAANGYLCTNQDDLYYLTFSNMSFHCTGSNAATATFMKSMSNGQAQNYLFDHVNWSGAWKYGLDLTGTNNNGELTWWNCSVRGDWTAFLFAGASGTSDQFVNYNFFSTNAEYRKGHFVDMAKGGNINVWGGGLIHEGDGTEATSSAQCFFRLRGASHASGVPRLYVAGVRVEHRHSASQLINCEWERGSIKFVSCDTETMQPILTTPTNVVQAEFGATAQSYPIIEFDSCSLMGKHKYHFQSGTYNHNHRIKYANCEIQTYLQAKDFISYVNDDPTDTGRAPAIVFDDNCRSSKATDYKEIFGTTVNWHDSVNTVVPLKALSIRIPWGGSSGLPNTSLNNWGANLPLNSMITRVYCSKGAGGASTATNVTYTLKDADNTVIAVATTGGAAWNTAWEFDSDRLAYRCSTDNKRQLTLTAANITESMADSYLLVEYL